MTSLASPVPRPRSAALQQATRLLDGGAAGLLLSAATDLALVVDGDGVVRGADYAGADLTGEGIEGWLGRPWADTVTVESRPKIDALLAEAAPSAVSRWRQVNHPSPRGADLPVRYATLRAGGDGPVIVLGRDLRGVAALQRRLADTQQTLERDYERLRAAETRYKLLFQLSREPVIVVDAGTRRITEVNPAAARRLGRTPRRVVGQDAAELFEAGHARDVQALFAGLRVTGQAADLDLRLAGGRGPARLSASLFRGEGVTRVLLRLSAEPEGAAEAAGSGAGAMAVIAQLPEGFVVTDRGRRVLSANTAFLDLVQLATEEQARAEPLERWLGREETEAQALFATLDTHGSVRHYATVLRGQYGSVEQMTDLVGRVSMKTLVRETTDLIEKLCIEAALRITRDNRASAAEMLGLSRQGLYAKMRRYGVGDLDGDPAEA